MNVTADQRTKVLKLFNISESARLLGMLEQEMFSRIRSGTLQSPKIPLGKRLYFSSDDLRLLAGKVQKKSHR